MALAIIELRNPVVNIVKELFRVLYKSWASYYRTVSARLVDLIANESGSRILVRKSDVEPVTVTQLGIELVWSIWNNHI